MSLLSHLFLYLGLMLTAEALTVQSKKETLGYAKSGQKVYPSWALKKNATSAKTIPSKMLTKTHRFASGAKRKGIGCSQNFQSSYCDEIDKDNTAGICVLKADLFSWTECAQGEVSKFLLDEWTQMTEVHAAECAGCSHYTCKADLESLRLTVQNFHLPWACEPATAIRPNDACSTGSVEVDDSLNRHDACQQCGETKLCLDNFEDVWRKWFDKVKAEYSLVMYDMGNCSTLTTACQTYSSVYSIDDFAFPDACSGVCDLSRDDFEFGDICDAVLNRTETIQDAADVMFDCHWWA